MKLGKIMIPVGLLALASVAANAQQSIPALSDLSQQNSGDLYLGFSNGSASKDLLFDVGPASDYYTAATAAALGVVSTTTNVWTGAAYTAPLTAGTSYTVSAYNSTDLANVFGANASSTSTLWSVVGGNGSDGGPLTSTPAQNVIWVSAPSTTSVVRGTNTVQQGVSLTLDTINNAMFNGGNFATPGSFVSNDAYTPGSKVFTQALTGGNNFNSTQFGGPVVGNTSATSSLELFELQPTASGTAAGVDLGTFTLTSTGLSFTAFSAIPEPSTYAMILGVAALGFVMLRRRKQVTA